MQVPFKASQDVLAALAGIGRTEDVHFSPNNSRLAVAGMMENRILILDVRIDATSNPVAVELTDYVVVESPSFGNPHGLFWIDDETLIVANRHGEVPIIRVPIEKPETRTLFAPALQTIRADETDLLQSPGSVSVSRLNAELVDVFICSNAAHYVTRHLVDIRSGFSVAASEVAFRDGLEIPDGVTHSASGRWLAVSNHNHHNVFIYRNETAGLSGADKPVGVLRGICYPHGVRFTPDERFMLVADAGAPFVHVFASQSGNWRGDRIPSVSVPVIDEESFQRGRNNPQEGGPKGIDVNRGGDVLVASCEEQPIAFFDIRETLGRAGEAASGNASADGPSASSRDPLLGRLASTREELGALRKELGEKRKELADLRKDLTDARQRTETTQQRVDELTSSTSWRVTAPLRRLSAALKRP